MEIKCSKSIGNWFDEISVINVKINSSTGPDRDNSLLNFQNLENEIKEQIGAKLFNEIIISDEYKELYRLNKMIFNLIGLLRKTKDKRPINWELLAEYGVKIDNRNTDRFLAKNNLQKKYFNSVTKEIKL